MRTSNFYFAIFFMHLPLIWLIDWHKLIACKRPDSTTGVKRTYLCFRSNWTIFHRLYIKYHFSIVKYSTWSEVEKWKQKFSLFITLLQLCCFSARAHQINVRRNNKISIEALVYCFSKSIFNCKFQWLFYALLDPAP